MAAESVEDFETTEVEFWSDDARLRGRLRLPSSTEYPLPGLVFTPGWLGLAESSATIHWLDAFARAGIAVLSFDYRGFGESEGERGQVRPDWQMEDIRNAVTFLGTRPEVDERRIGLFGKGGTGGGNAYLAGALDERVACVVAMTSVADGAMWLRRMRREYEWRAFLEQVAEAERTRVLEGTDPTVNPRTEIMVAAPERAAAPGKSAVDERVGSEFRFSTASHILRYRPLDMAPRLRGRPVMLIGIEEDVVTPFDHSRLLFEALAGAPRRMVVLTQTAHYAADSNYFPRVSVMATDWAVRYLRPRQDWTEEDLSVDDVIWLEPAARKT